MTANIDYFRTAKQITARQAADRYGLAVDARGYAKCPFHADSKPSLRFYPRGDAHCFVCNRTYDSIDVAGAMLAVSPLAAARVVCTDFGLQPVKTQLQLATQRREREAQRQTKQIENRVFCLACDVLRQLESECRQLRREDADNKRTWALIGKMARLQDELGRC